MGQLATHISTKGKSRGGRPKKEVCQDQQLALMCSLSERKIIESKASLVGMTISAFLRSLALNGQVVNNQKSLPMEVLQLTGNLNHLAANLNQIAKKRNGFEELDERERAILQERSNELREIAKQIKQYLK